MSPQYLFSQLIFFCSDQVGSIPENKKMKRKLGAYKLLLHACAEKSWTNVKKIKKIKKTYFHHEKDQTLLVEERDMKKNSKGLYHLAE